MNLVRLPLLYTATKMERETRFSLVYWVDPNIVKNSRIYSI